MKADLRSARMQPARRKLPMLCWYLVWTVLFAVGAIPETQSYLYTSRVHYRAFFIRIYSVRVHSDGYAFGYLWRWHLLAAVGIGIAVLMLPLICGITANALRRHKI